MRLLLDSCVGAGAVRRLRAAGHDVVWSGDWPADPCDEEILARALSEGRVLVTLDKDFGELAIVRELPHTGILRLVGLSALQQAAGGTARHARLATLKQYADARAPPATRPGALAREVRARQRRRTKPLPRNGNGPVAKAALSILLGMHISARADHYHQ